MILEKLEQVTNSGTEWKAICPAHEDRSPSLSIRQSGNQVLLHCHAGCKTLDIVHAMDLDFRDLFLEDDTDMWGEVYKDLIQGSKLSPSDYTVLVARGLTDEWVNLGGYRSLADPTTRHSVIKLQEKHGDLLGSVPGFVVNKSGKYRIKAQSGILLPVCDISGKVAGFQIKTGSEPKYIWFTGDTAAKVSCHVPWQAMGRDKLRITEGVLKADIACCLDDSTTTVGVPGVTNWQSALLVARSLQPKEVYIAFDMDWCTNANVKNALTELFYGLKNEGITPLIEVWDPAHKGIDDALAAGSPISILRSIPSDESIPNVRPATEYKPVKVEWMWRGWLPKGMLVVLEGDPSLGKSTLCADIAMRITTCTPFPGEVDKPVCGSVLFLSAEDDPGSITVPRMKAAGADLNKVYFWDHSPTFPKQIAELERIIEQLGIVLVILDPLLAFLDDTVDSYKDQSMRQMLTPLKKMAERTNCTVLMIRHLTKGSAQVSQMYKGGGSIAVVAAARVCLYMVHDEDSGDRVLGQVKNNLAPKQSSWAFEFLEGADWQDTKLHWKGRSEL